MRVIIDRFEGDFAVVEMEDKTMVNMPQILLPKNVKEGDSIEIIVKYNTIKNREKTIRKLMDDVWE